MISRFQNKAASFVVLVLLLAGALHASADPFFTVDDPGTPEAHHYEVDLLESSSQLIGSEAEQQSISINYGYTNNSAFLFSTGVQSNRNSGSGRLTGVTDSTLEEVWRFQEETKNIPQILLHNATKIPTAPSDNGLGTGKVDDSFDITLGKSFGNAAVYANVGYTWLGARSQKDNTFWGVKLNYQATDKIVAGIELYGNSTSAQGSHQEIAIGTGISYDLTSDESLLVTVGKSTEGFSDLNATIGLQWELGPQTPDVPAHAATTPTAKS